MRVLLDYIEERTDELRLFKKILTSEPLDKNEPVIKACCRYMGVCSEIQKAIVEIVTRFGDMKVGESVKRFGTIEGELKNDY